MKEEGEGGGGVGRVDQCKEVVPRAKEHKGSKAHLYYSSVSDGQALLRNLIPPLHMFQM